MTNTRRPARSTVTLRHRWRRAGPSRPAHRDGSVRAGIDSL